MRKYSLYYDSIAKNYDKIYNCHKVNIMRTVENKIINNEINNIIKNNNNNKNNKNNYLILDIGCGTGEQLKKIKTENVIGLDISYKMAKIAHDKSKKPVVVGNGEYLPFKNKSFNCVISFFGALNHLEINRVMKEINRILKPNGKVIFTVANVYDYRWIINNIYKKGIKNTKKALTTKKGEIVKYIDNKKIKVKTKFYSINEIENIVKKHNFKIKYTFGTNITNTPLDNLIYKSFLKKYSWYVGIVAIKGNNKNKI